MAVATSPDHLAPGPATRLLPVPDRGRHHDHRCAIDPPPLQGVPPHVRVTTTGGPSVVTAPRNLGRLPPARRFEFQPEGRQRRPEDQRAEAAPRGAVEVEPEAEDRRRYEEARGGPGPYRGPE